MMANEQAAVNYIVEDEGPELNLSPNEPGGGSIFGVSLLALTEDYAHLNMHAPTLDTLKSFTRADAVDFYERMARRLRFNDFNRGIDYMILNSSVTIGPTGSALTLQMCIDMWPTTGLFDDLTVAQINSADPKMIIHSMGSAWLAWKSRSSKDGWKQYGHGWINRDRRVRSRALQMAGIR